MGRNFSSRRSRTVVSPCCPCSACTSRPSQLERDPSPTGRSTSLTPPSPTASPTPRSSPPQPSPAMHLAVTAGGPPRRPPHPLPGRLTIRVLPRFIAPPSCAEPPADCSCYLGQLIANPGDLLQF